MSRDYTLTCNFIFVEISTEIIKYQENLIKKPPLCKGRGTACGGGIVPLRMPYFFPAKKVCKNASVLCRDRYALSHSALVIFDVFSLGATLFGVFLAALTPLLMCCRTCSIAEVSGRRGAISW